MIIRRNEENNQLSQIATPTTPSDGVASGALRITSIRRPCQASFGKFLTGLVKGLRDTNTIFNNYYTRAYAQLWRPKFKLQVFYLIISELKDRARVKESAPANLIFNKTTGVSLIRQNKKAVGKRSIYLTA